MMLRQLLLCLAPLLGCAAEPAVMPRPVDFAPWHIEMLRGTAELWRPHVHTTHRVIFERFDDERVECVINGRRWYVSRTPDIHAVAKQPWGGWTAEPYIWLGTDLTDDDFPIVATHEWGHAIMYSGEHSADGVMASPVYDLDFTPSVLSLCREKGACP